MKKIEESPPHKSLSPPKKVKIDESKNDLGGKHEGKKNINE